MRYFRPLLLYVLLGVLLLPSAEAQQIKKPTGQLTANQAKTANGVVEGTLEASGIRAFKGVPFAAPPVGEMRWREPQPVKNWQGVRNTKQFGPRAMQLQVFGDMGFRSDGMSEDCLYLNVWTPAKTGKERLPVLVYFYGGGFVAGDGSEARYDGESMAKQGMVAITVNYRLGVFGFFAHPELTRESPHHSSGNYGYLDQSAALHWVKQNIAAFGGDPARVTIAGESAGSISVSAQMASPLSRDLLAGAIGESGALVNSGLDPIPLAEAEPNGVAFATAIGANSLAALRAMPAQQLLEEAGKPGVGRFMPTIDGYFFPKTPAAIFAAGEQAKVPLLAGWNSEEMTYMFLLGSEQPTVENYQKVVRTLYGEQADAILKAYPATNNAEVIQAATDLAGDRFIAYSTWKWIDLHSKTGNAPVYRYLYARPRPPMVPEMGNAAPGLAGGVVKEEDTSAVKMPVARGAVHSAEIEYAMGNLASNKTYAWTPDDYKVSEVMQGYFANFIKTGNPNGKALPNWPAANKGDQVQVLHIDVNTVARHEQHRARYELLDKLRTK
ncbi:carboxylesterase family protein [Pontibacter sp. E15-1]|uniref:carboxylesterase/lipase family protein n=1 Tax=Pontibacter sp. E15-1 TaxID=2919918 RepID=UPI001F4F4E1F|nr:carboxylesterase family protein [Pontibacter sp. E15-1]MCJ8164153.1 carboxylesterase family protein [Pontibacter sp. E15-1]